MILGVMTYLEGEHWSHTDAGDAFRMPLRSYRRVPEPYSCGLSGLTIGLSPELEVTFSPSKRQLSCKLASWQECGILVAADMMPRVANGGLPCRMPRVEAITLADILDATVPPRRDHCWRLPCVLSVPRGWSVNWSALTLFG